MRQTPNILSWLPQTCISYQYECELPQLKENALEIYLQGMKNIGSGGGT